MERDVEKTDPGFLQVKTDSYKVLATHMKLIENVGIDPGRVKNAWFHNKQCLIKK